MAGVSRGVVSAVLNDRLGTIHVSEATRQRILKMAGQTHYITNSFARALRMGRTMSIGIIVPSLSMTYSNAIAASAEYTLRRAGYTSMIISADYNRFLPDMDNFERSFHLICQQQIDAVLAVGYTTSHYEFFEKAT